MDDIAREMGILKGSLYYWIESKEALLEEVLSLNPTLEEVAEAERIIARPIPASERLRLMVHLHVSYWLRYPHNFRVFIDYGASIHAADMSPSARGARRQQESLEAQFKRLIAEGRASGEFTVDEHDISIIVNSMLGMLNWFPRWYRSKGPASADYIADVMTNLILGGLTQAARWREVRDRVD